MSAEAPKAPQSKGPVARPVKAPAFGGGLLASKPPKNRSAYVTGAFSTALHFGLAALAVAATVGNQVVKEDDEVTVMEMTQEMEAPPPPPPPPVDAPQAPISGFQTLSVPDIIPAEIPPPGEVAFKAADFTGQGIQAGSSTEKKDENVVAIGETPSFTPFTVAPQLQNRDEVGRALEREYPSLLRDAGVGGKVDVWIRISDQGKVENVQVHTSSGQPALDEAALKVAQVMQFSAAMNRDKQVPVWVSIPITFQVR
jgi:TonB family protein